MRIPLDWPHTRRRRSRRAGTRKIPPTRNYHWQDADLAVAGAVAGRARAGPAGGRRAALGAALPDPGRPPDAICDPDPAALAAFATAAAQRYSGKFLNLPRVQYWQGLNEPNLSLFFFPQYDTAGHALSPGLYRALIDSFYARGEIGRPVEPGARRRASGRSR